MSGGDAVTEALAGLDARSWAPLLRALRGIGATSAELSTALEPPTSALASGPARRALCAAVADDPATVALLRADTSLPAAVHAALAVGSEPDTAGSDAGSDRDDEDDEGDAAHEGTGMSDRAPERARALRRTLEEERRRREGAEARADAAEARAAAAAEAAQEAAARTVTLEAALADAEESVRQAAARAERRAEARIATLEAALATARSEAESQRIEHERTRAELAAMRAELDDLRARGARSSRHAAVTAAGSPGSRPLVLPAGLVPDTTEAARWLADHASLLLLDGYNIVLTLHPGRPLEEQRRWLVDRVRPLVVGDGARPVVVFDGAGVSGRMRDTGGVEVRFTAGGASADDEIVFMVAATDEPVLVVTDDVELQARVRADGGDVVGTVHLLGIVGA